MHFCEWLLINVIDDYLKLHLYFMTDKARLHLNDFINTENRRCCSATNFKERFHVSLHGKKNWCWVYCVQQTNWKPFFFISKMTSEAYVTELLQPFIAQLTEKERNYPFLAGSWKGSYFNFFNGLSTWSFRRRTKAVSKGLRHLRSPNLFICGEIEREKSTAKIRIQLKTLKWILEML